MVSLKTLFILLILTLAACQPVVVEDSPVETIKVVEVTEEVVEIDRGSDPIEEYAVVVTGVEGEVITLNPEAIDPDEDVVEYLFSEPFDTNGKWKTNAGDEGDYVVTVKAFDGEDYTSNDILVRVKPADKKPVINCPQSINVEEGDFIKIDCGIYDPEGNEVVVIYRGFMESSRYQTTFQDAGKHTVTVTGWDKENVQSKVSDMITINIKDVNIAPEVFFAFDSEVRGKEGDLIVVTPKVVDTDGDDISIKYSAPFDSDGTWQTEIGDAGVYDAEIVVSDGKEIIIKKFTVVIEESNTAPKFKNLKRDVYVSEGQTVELNIDATDREGHPVRTKISGYMTSDKYTTNYDEAYPVGCDTKGCTAKYTVVVTVSDGKLDTTEEITVHVKDKNRPPIFKVPA